MPILNTIQADLDASSSDYGKFVLVMTGYGAATTYQVGITGPGGYVVQAFPASPEYTGANYTLKLPIPLTTAGDFLEGDYEFRIKKVGASSVDETKTFCLTFASKTMVLTATADCYAKSLVINDVSEYPTGTVVRDIVVDTPVIDGNDDVADTTYTTAAITIDMVRSSGNAYSNVTYGIVGNTTVTTEEIDGEWSFGYVLSYTGVTTSVLVRCDTDACGIISCVNDSIQSLYTKACNLGGFSRLPQAEIDKLLDIQLNLSMYNYYNSCRDNTNALVYYDKLKVITGDCDCEQTGPTVIADSTFTYLRGYSAYELWVQEGNTGTIDDFFSALFPITDWAEVDSSYYINNYLKDSNDPLMYRLTKTHIEFKGAIDAVIASTTTSNPDDFLSASFDPIDVIEDGNAVVRNDADHAGYLFKQLSDGKWKLRWNSNFSRAANQFVFGQIPIDGYLTSGVQLNALGWTEIPSGQYESGHVQYIADPLNFRTDGNYLVFRGGFTANAILSPGVDLIDPDYWTAQGVVMEDATILSVYNYTTRILVGYAKVESGTLRVYPITDPSVPSASLDLFLEGIIPLQ